MALLRFIGEAGMHTKNKMRISFEFFGIIFFIMATCYFGMLLWKSYTWYRWLNELEENLFRQTPPTEGPLVNPYDNWTYYHPTEGLKERF